MRFRKNASAKTCRRSKSRLSMWVTRAGCPNTLPMIYKLASIDHQRSLSVRPGVPALMFGVCLVWYAHCRRRLNIQVFELLTGEYLFDPKEARTYRKDEDHIAQMIELLGDFPAHFIRSGMYANEIFNSR